MLKESSVVCFLAVAKHLSFTKAAEELFMSRQAVSKTILSLEKRLAVKLFYRKANIVELTTEGRLCLTYFRNQIQDIESFISTLRKPGAQSESLLIGYELGVAVDSRVLDALGEYRRQKANTDYKILRYIPQVIESKLLNGKLSLAFTTIPEQSEVNKNFSYIIMEQVDYVLITAKSHPKVNEHTVLSDFNGEQAIYWNMDNSPNSVCLKSFYATWSDIGITVIPAIQCTYLSSGYAEMLLNNAVMLCAANSELCSFPEIVAYPLPKKGYFGCVWSRGAPPEVQRFAETFRKFEVKRRG